MSTTFSPYLKVILAGVLFGFSASLIKWISLPTTSLLSIRLAIPTIVVLLFIFIKKKKIRFNWRLVIASILNSSRLYFYILGFVLIDIGTAVIILYTWPIFTYIFSVFLLKEKIQRKNLYLLITAFVGIVIVYINQDFSLANINFIGMSAILFSSILYALSVVLFKKVDYSKTENLFYQNILGGFLFLPFVFVNQPLPTPYQWSLSIFYSLLIEIICYLLFFSALKKIKASTASHILYIEVVSAIICGILFFNESLTINNIIGGSLILFSAFMIKA
jgi:drug/metabolite transporter (DMT)-like permease